MLAHFQPLGDQLGLYKAMAGSGPITSQELSAQTGAAERYVREWLNAQAAGGYVTYPNSRFAGFDLHGGSIERAQETAAASDVADRVQYAVASAKDFPGRGYDLVCSFDSLHDMGDPVGVAPPSDRGQPEPDRADLLRGLDAVVHAVVPLPGGRTGPWSAGR